MNNRDDEDKAAHHGKAHSDHGGSNKSDNKINILVGDPPLDDNLSRDCNR